MTPDNALNREIKYQVEDDPNEISAQTKVKKHSAARLDQDWIAVHIELITN